MANEVIIRVTARDDTAGVRDIIRGGFGVTGRQAGEDFQKGVTEGTKGVAPKAEQDGKDAGKSFGKGMDDAVKPAAKKAGEDAATEAGKAAKDKAKADANAAGQGGILGPLILAGAPLIGAAAGAAIVGGVGLGLIGLAAVVAKSNDGVKAQLQAFKADVVTTSQAWGSEMSKPVTQAIGTIKVGFDNLRPAVGTALGNMGPDIALFAQGITGLATQAMPGLTAASGRMIPVFQGLSGLMSTVGQATGQMASDVSQHSTQIGTSIGYVGQVIATLETVAGHLIGDLSDTFAHTGGTLVTTLHSVGDVISGLSSTAMPALGAGIQTDLTVINALISALGPVSSLLGTFGGTALSAYMNASLLGKLQGPISSMADSLDKAGTKGTTFGNVTSTMSKGLGKVGDSLPIIGVGLAVLGTVMELDSAHATALTDASDKLAASLEQGGTQAAKARKEMADARAANQDYTNSAIALSAAQVQGTQDSSVYGQMAGSNARQIGELTQKVQDNKQVADDALKKYNDWAAGMGLTAITASQLSGSTDILASSTQSASSNTSQLKADLDIMGAAASTTDAKIKALTDTLAIMGDHGMQKAQDYAAQLGTALDSFSTSMASAKGAVFGLNGELDTNSARGRAVLTVLEAAQVGWAGQAQSMANAGRSTAEINQTLDTNRQQLYGVLAAAGLTKDQINRLIDTYGLVPKSISTQVHANTQPAMDATQNLLRYINGQRAVVTIDTVTGNTQALRFGGGHTASASGGVTSPMPGAASGMVLPGGFRVVGEQGAELIRDQVGATVVPRSGVDKAITDALGSGGGSAPQSIDVRFAGNTDGALATAIMQLFYQGLIKIYPQFNQR
jgi:hypothetical protein